MKKLSLFTCVLLMSAIAVASAQDTVLTNDTTRVGGIDLSPFIETLMPILATILTALATWIGWYVKNWVAKKVDLSQTQLDEQIQQMYNEAAARSIAYAESIVKGTIPKTVDIDNEYVSVAAGYLMKFWPDLVKQIGLTPESVKKTILARLPSGAMTEKADAIVLAKAGVVSTTPTETK